MADPSDPESFPTAHPETDGGPVDGENGHSSFPIVGVGASAGGLEAYKQLLTNLSDDTGMAFVLVQHLDPRHESRLTDLLVRHTVMPIAEAEHGMAVEPNHIYIIPPNADLAISRGVLQLSRRPDGRGPHLPIDSFFRALAADQKNLAVGVVLSGTGSDGAQGLSEIKAVGGITFAQDEESARFSGMPQSAAQSGCADLVLPPGEIARRLAKIRTHPYLEVAAPTEIPAENSESLYRRVLGRIRAITGVDFSQYRDTTIQRRIMRRMALYTQDSLAQYTQRLENDANEVKTLYHDLLINVTSFFRDPAVFEALKTKVYPEISEGKGPTRPIRIWVPGCSTGQEAYSIAMSLIEFFDNKPAAPPIQIFATDISDPSILEKGRAGIYPDNIEAEVSPERLRRFFHKEDHTYRIEKSLRDLCVFARQNLASDPPFSHVDLVSCRNLLIYLSAPLQKRVLPTLHYALNVPGFLVLGSSETVGEYSDLFEPVERTGRIYRKKHNQTRPFIHFTADLYAGIGQLPGARPLGPASSSADFQREADRLLLGRFVPPGVLVNDNLDIIQFRGRTSPFLETPPGEPTTNLLKMAREGLFIEVRSAVAEARQSHQPVRREGLRLRSRGEVRTVNIEVIPVTPAGVRENCFLILFEDEEPPRPQSAETVATMPRQFLEEQELLQVRKELSATKEYLQSLNEQQDAGNEELRSANEEILSSNEELQSTNEEMETAREELQSTNEELTTVNEALQNRNAELNQLNDDLTNLLDSTGLPVVMVGPDLRIRRFTQAARRAMNLLANDIGRPIGDLKTNIEIPDLEEMIHDVVERVQVRERQVRDLEGRWYTLRIHPYRSADHRIEGAVILLLDIDDSKKNADALRSSEERLRLAVEAGSLGTWYCDLKGDQRYWDERMHSLLGLPPGSEHAGDQFVNAIHPDDRGKLLAAQRRAVEENGGFYNELRFIRPNGSVGWLSNRAKVFTDATGASDRIAGVCFDITAQKQAEAAFAQRLDELKEADRQKNEFLALLSHELRNPLAPISNAVELLKSLGSQDPKLLSSREVIAREVEHLARMLEDLLDLSRLSRDRLALRKERLKLADVVRDAVMTSRPFFDGKRHQLTVSMPVEEFWVEADRVRLCQALANLLINAAKYTPEGGQVSIGAEPNIHEVLICVRDNGIGMSQELLGRIFEMFSQGEPGGAEGGLGIGLTLVKSLIAMHGGTIEAKSDGPAHGSEFIVRLPLIAAPAQVTREAPAEIPTLAPAPRRILVVDDSEIQATTLSRLLASYGHDVRTAFNGPAALTILGDFVPDVALIDLGLPKGMSGLDLARRMRADARFAHTVLLAQTGWGRDEDQERSRQAGFNFHLVKPLDHRRLQRIINGQEIG